MNILIIYGGKSAEHDISIITGCLARTYFEGFDITCCYFDSQNTAYFVDKVLTPFEHKSRAFKTKILFGCGNGNIYLKKGKRIVKQLQIDCAINCCHGVNGEDGAIAGILQMANIPNAESAISASGVAIDKVLTKLVAQSLGIPVLKGIALSSAEDLNQTMEKIQSEIGFPVILKPATLGSSIGINVAHDAEQLKTALEVAFAFDNKVLAEQALVNFYELNCSALTVDGKVQTSKIEKPISASQILTFSDKYLSSGAKGFSLKTQQAEQKHFEKVEQLTVQLYNCLDLFGVIRIDFIVDKDSDTLYLNEINTIPGSLSYGMWQEKYTKKQFAQILVDSALNRFSQRQKLTFRFVSNVLSSMPKKK